MRLTGIIDYTMDNFLCIRGFASMLELSEISKADENIQRDLIVEHQGEMEAFLSSGKFTFFPEVILAANMEGDESDREKINYLREAVHAERGLRKTVINDIKYWIKRNAAKKENSDLTYDVTLTVIMEFDKTALGGKEFLRIDGNHRLSAVNSESAYREKRIPYCLLLFRNEVETDMFCRALFYNINTKQIPLKAEQNFKVIIDSEQTFDDDTLITDPSFGYNFYLARQTIRNLDMTDYPFVKMLVSESRYTYFIDVIKLLIDDKLVEKNDDSINVILSVLTKINEALETAFINEVPRNIAIIEAFTLYTLQAPNKAIDFLEWAKKNKLIEISNLSAKEVIDIYDKVYSNKPKKIFLSMWFNENTKDTYKEINDVKSLIKNKYKFELEIIKVDEHKDGYSDSISRRIIEGIDSCDLLIADLTYGNKNVHHEIGYAQGKGKRVLLLYRIRDNINPADEIGSNLSMYDQLRFRSYQELRDELTRKIEDYFEL